MQVENNEVNFREVFEKAENEVKKVIFGQEEIIHEILVAIVAGGNVLMEGSPGLGKTELVKTFSRILSLPFSRIQFTPDLMPSDIVGTDVIKQDAGKMDFEFKKGPIFSSLVLADEINRATPKTQSALLEAMQEHTVTVGNSTYELPKPFFVLATQNAIENEGTYTLPEAQLDRFMSKIYIKMPAAQDLMRIVEHNVNHSEKQIESILDGGKILKMRSAAKKIVINSELKEKIIKIIVNTHPDTTDLESVKKYVDCGASPRGIQAIIASSQIRAAAKGRYSISFDDIKESVRACLGHRVFLNFKGQIDEVTSTDILEEILRKVQ